jgi:hypothetical protein
MDAAKAFGKIQHLNMIKALKEQGIKKPNLNIIQAISDKPLENIIRMVKK